MRYTEDQLKEMTKPSSDSEEQRMENATRMVREALANNGIIKTGDYEIFPQGSYANNTNIRNDSDVDINVCYTGAFFFDLPSGKNRFDYGFYEDAKYSFGQFKDDVESILVKKFGRNQVIRKNKCIHVKENTYRTEIDVVPTWEYRRFFGPRTTDYVRGVKLLPDNGGSVVNFPKQHLTNGRSHNVDTRERFKKLVRIVKRIHLDMEKDGFYNNSKITSFLLESMVYLLPNSTYNLYTDYFRWTDVLREAIVFWYNATKTGAKEWQEWKEVSELLYLMYGHKWSSSDVNEFTLNLWRYLGYS